MLITVLVIIVAIWAIYTVGTMLYNRKTIKNYSTSLENIAFDAKMTGQQIIDLRDPSAFRVKHIMGARNIQAGLLKSSLDAIRKDKPIFLYDERGLQLAGALRQLHKAGYNDVYTLKGGFTTWTGKTKSNA